MRLRVAIIGCIALCLVSKIVSAQTLERTAREVLTEVQELSGRPALEFSGVHTLLDRHFDHETFARQSMGRLWSDLQPTQQSQLTADVRRLVEQKTYREFRNKIGKTIPAYTLKVLERRPGHPSIEMVFHRRQGDFTVELFMRHNAGTWQIYDLTLAGANMLRNYRAQFTRVYREQGFAVLLNKIREQADERPASQTAMMRP